MYVYVGRKIISKSAKINPLKDLDLKDLDFDKYKCCPPDICDCKNRNDYEF